MTKSLAIIPARGGSKRIPKKNIRNFCGKPILTYSIKTAIDAKCFSTIMVSTDCEEISSIAEKHGAKIPFLRSKNTSNDYATLSDVIEEVLKKYLDIGYEFSYACCILPTAPLLTVESLLKGADLVIKENADSSLAVVQFSYPIQRALQLVNNRVQMMLPKHERSRSNDLAPCYHDAGQFYWINVNRFLKSRSLLMKNTKAIILPETKEQDIDTEEDWKLAELKYTMIHPQ